jgi:nicotinamidase-related amidase
MDAETTALLIIDVQQGLFEKHVPIYKAEELLKNINFLVGRAHECGVPVFFIQHSDSKTLVKGSRGWQLHPQLHHQRIDYLIHKQQGNAFEDTQLDTILKSNHISRLVVAGLVTHGCVKATCLGARLLGYEVILVNDAHSNFSNDAPQLIDKWNQKLAAQDCKLVVASLVTFDS